MKRILAVDDSTSMRQMVSFTLKKAGFEVTEAKDGSELKTKLEALADELKAADQKADFYGDAHKAGITDLKLAYLAAVDGELFDKRGNANLGKLKEDHPELFEGKRKIKGNIADG
ncbi:hypothetical protein LCGC14_1928440, partial [marine sediment metagenome]